MSRVPIHAFSPRPEPGPRCGKYPYELHGFIEAALLPVPPRYTSMRFDKLTTEFPHVSSTSLTCSVRAAALISIVDLLSPDRMRHGCRIATLDLHLFRRQLALLQEPGGALWRPTNSPAASCGVSSSVLARHSVLDTESSRALLDTGFRRYDELAARRGGSTLNGMTPCGLNSLKPPVSPRSSPCGYPT